MLTLNLHSTAAVVLAIFISIASVSDAQKPTCDIDNLANTGGIWYQDPALRCSKEYEVCRSGSWRKIKCVLGYFDRTIGKCVRFDEATSGCQIDDNAYFEQVRINNGQTGRKRRDVSNSSESSELLHRSERQTTNCPSPVDPPCPSNIQQVIIFPNFADTSCTDYYLCLRGVLLKDQCEFSQLYTFYNPRLMSCEQYPGLTNTCVWRDHGNYLPLDGDRI